MCSTLLLLLTSHRSYVHRNLHLILPLEGANKHNINCRLPGQATNTTTGSGVDQAQQQQLQSEKDGPNRRLPFANPVSGLWSSDSLCLGRQGGLLVHWCTMN